MQSLTNSEDFNSTKHAIITRTSISENHINWGDMLSRDKNFGKAREKFDAAIQICMDAINQNTRDSKIYTSLTKAHLKKAHLLLQINKNYEAIKCLNHVISSRDNSYKHSLFKLTALIDLTEHYIKKGQLNKVKSLLNTISTEKFKAILRNPKYQKLNDRLQYIKSSQDTSNKTHGVISKANDEYGYVIISTENEDRTFIGGADDFIPRLANIDLSLIGVEVLFTEKIFMKGDKEKSHAKFIKIKVANKTYKQ
jgi:tetratricopeptide (TPR) repeat protein